MDQHVSFRSHNFSSSPSHRWSQIIQPIDLDVVVPHLLPDPFPQYKPVPWFTSHVSSGNNAGRRTDYWSPQVFSGTVCLISREF